MFAHICWMLKKLQQHWGVKGWRFFLILCTFAVTGTFTAWVSKSITQWLDAEKFTFYWWLLKIFVLLIGYQVFILFFGFCFGQFAFFWKFEKKILTRLGLFKKESRIYHLAIFASGTGSNAKKILEYFTRSEKVSIDLIVCNKDVAGVLEVAREHQIEIFINKQDHSGDQLLHKLKGKQIDLIILAGYLWMLPNNIINAYPKKIINIHPALLPKYGGKGMYGNYVHEAVIRNNEKESGITIHYADELYDNGEIIFQQKCLVDPGESAASLAEKIRVLEHTWYPQIIGSVVEKQNQR